MTFYTYFNYQEFFWRRHTSSQETRSFQQDCAGWDPCRILSGKKYPGVAVDIAMPFLPCLKKKKSPVPLGRNIFQKHTPPIQQNYQALLETCLRNKCLFTDDNFPAHISSIGTGALLKKLPQNLQWKRPHVSDFQWTISSGRMITADSQQIVLALSRLLLDFNLSVP